MSPVSRRPGSGAGSLIALHTPHLARAVTDYTRVLGFTCQQHIPGLLAWLTHGPLELQLWACAAGGPAWTPAQHTVVVGDGQALYDSWHRAVHRCARTGLAGVHHPHAHRLSDGGPLLQAWGSREFSLTDVDGQRLHCIEWGIVPCGHQGPPQGQRSAYLEWLGEQLGEPDAGAGGIA